MGETTISTIITTIITIIGFAISYILIVKQKNWLYSNKKMSGKYKS